MPQFSPKEDDDEEELVVVVVQEEVVGEPHSLHDHCQLGRYFALSSTSHFNQHLHYPRALVTSAPWCRIMSYHVVRRCIVSHGIGSW